MESEILELFFNYPTKYWHFKELKNNVPIADNKLSRWLKKFISEETILKIKEKGKMPYYVANYEFPDYQNKKRIFALNKLYASGLLNHLSSLKNAKTVILFGSFTRWDWYSNSDIDLFVYGSADDLEIGKYELKLNREIQVFICKNRRELRKFNAGLIKNIVKGDLIKGDIDFLEMTANA